MIRKRLLMAALCAVPVSPLDAQVASGNLYGAVSDATGSVLPAVEVTLDGEGVVRSTVTGPDGRFRLLGLSRATYTLVLERAGFATLRREVRIVTGENVDLRLTLEISPRQEVVRVGAATPLVDPRRRGTPTTLTADELDQVPNPRDAWAILLGVPGVLIDRVNLAGTDCACQPPVAGKGTAYYSTGWTLDGVEVSDLRGGGATATYFDFGSIDEIQVTTGVQDLRSDAGGLSVHVAQKRGTNAFHGSAGTLFSHDALSPSNLPDELRGDPRLLGSEKADHIEQLRELSVELGGPILRDRLWFYASWGQRDLRSVDLGQKDQKTVVEGWNARLHWQASPETQVSGLWHFSQKRLWSVTGWGGVAADSFRQDSRHASTSGGLPPGLWTIQIDHTFSPRLMISARASHFDNGFGFYARGPGDRSFTLDYTTGEALGTSNDVSSLLPDTQLALDGHGFLEGLGGAHELSFGLGYRDLSEQYRASFAGGQLSGALFGPGDAVARVNRDASLHMGVQSWSAYLGDTFTRERVTLHLGLRWDGRSGRNRPSQVGPNPTFPELLPALSYSGNAGDLATRSELSPRFGGSLALDEARRTVLRASYAEYSDRLWLTTLADVNPGRVSFIAYAWDDRNADRAVQPSEVLLDRLLFASNVDPSRPSEVLEPAGRLDRELEPQRDHEVVIGIDRELAPSLAAGLAWTWRRASRLTYWPWLAGRCPEDATREACPIAGPESYTPNAPVTANGYTAFTWSPDPDLIAAGGFGRLTTQYPGYTRHYSGLELTLTKRLSKGWMGRVALSLNDWVERFEGRPVGYFGNPTPDLRWPLVDGGQIGHTGKNDVPFTSVRWQVYANAMVELPWELRVSGALFGRQGHPYAKFLPLPAGNDGVRPALAQERLDVDRYDDVWILDLRLDRLVSLGRTTLTFSAELFNALNSGVVVARDGNARATSFDRIDEILSPRLLRLGAQVSF